MDREQAVEALELLRRVVGQARDDTTLQNWGVIWMLHAVTNGVGFVLTNVLVWRGYVSPWPYVMLWALILPVNIGSIFFLKAHPAGVWTFFESMIWLVWLTFIGAVLLTTVSNFLSGFQILQLGPATAVLSAYAFAMMGGMMGKTWFGGAAVFAAAALAMGLFPTWQFVILGIAWALVQSVAGAILHRQRRQRLAAGAPVRLV
jgi:hypothetical protein